MQEDNQIPIVMTVHIPIYYRHTFITSLKFDGKRVKGSPYTRKTINSKNKV